MGLLNSLESSKMRLQAITDGTPTLLKEAPLDGTYHWVYRIPLLLTYYDQSIKKDRKRAAPKRAKSEGARGSSGWPCSDGHEKSGE
jgi:hypothetical protein